MLEFLTTYILELIILGYKHSIFNTQSDPVAKRRSKFGVRCSTFDINIEQGISNDE